MRPVQYFSDEYLDQCKQASTAQVLEFLESYRLLQTAAPQSKLISMKVPETLLASFRNKCDIQHVKYQTQIKNLMRVWLDS